VTEVHITPAGADFRSNNRKVIQVLENEISERNLFLRGMIDWLGFNTAYFHFDVHKRSGGRYNYSWGRFIFEEVKGRPRYILDRTIKL
jgi:dolichol-phosphate mannosyltransferase